MIISVLDRVENIVGKGEIACSSNFSFSNKVFKKLIPLDASKGVIVWEWVKMLSPVRSLFFPRTNDSLCDRIHSSLTAVSCFDNGNVGKQPVVGKEYCAGYWLKELQESMNRSPGQCNITEILLKWC